MVAEDSIFKHLVRRCYFVQEEILTGVRKGSLVGTAKLATILIQTCFFLVAERNAYGKPLSFDPCCFP
jgi:hypothetical protein